MFKGVYTALITPFQEDESVDFSAYRDLIHRQIDGGVDGIVPVGTTGESPTLTMSEHKKVIEEAISAAAGRIQVIAGTGGNSTAEAVELTRFAKEAGADATLQVTPYYNKPTDEGLFRHFTAIADLGLPVVLYNVPGRTSRALTVELVVRLRAHPMIQTVKEAAGDAARVSEYLRVCDIGVLSGDDSLTLPMMAAGGQGVISVASNVIPAEVSRMVHAALVGNWAQAREDHDRLFPLFEDLFLETNPIPVKAAVAWTQNRSPVYRLPLCEMSKDHTEQLRSTLQALGALA